MKRFKGPVVFEGTLTRLLAAGEGPDTLMVGQPFKIKIKMMEAGVLGLMHPMHVYPKRNAVEKWKTIVPDARVRFAAQVSGISAMGMGDQFIYAVLLTDAEPLETSK